MKLPKVFGPRRSGTVVGLDIGSSAVKAVEIKGSGKKRRVVACGAEPLPAGSIVDGAVVDGAAVAGAIRHLFGRVRFSTKDVAASLSGSAVIVKKITLPAMTGQELAESIQWEAEQYIPFDIQDVCLDYQVLDGPVPGAGKSMDVLLVAAKREKVADYTAVIAASGCVPAIVDVDAFALQNALEANYGHDVTGVVAFLNVGASTINLAIVSGGQALFTRNISAGGNAYVEALHRDLGLSAEDAARAMRFDAVPGVEADDVRGVLYTVTDAVLLEVEKTVDFFRASATTERFDRIFVSGGASLVEGFGASVAERLGGPVDDFDPFRTIGFDAARLGLAEGNGFHSTAAVAVGLALRRVGDR